MPFKKIVVHPECIEYELGAKKMHPDDRAEAERALKECREAIKNATNLIITDDLPLSDETWGLKNPSSEGDVYLLKDDDPAFVRDFIQPGDEVEILGAYRDVCVTFAGMYAEKAGANVTISETGTYLGRRERQ